MATSDLSSFSAQHSVGESRAINWGDKLQAALKSQWRIGCIVFSTMQPASGSDSCSLEEQSFRTHWETRGMERKLVLTGVTSLACTALLSQPVTTIDQHEALYRARAFLTALVVGTHHEHTVGTWVVAQPWEQKTSLQPKASLFLNCKNVFFMLYWV